MQATHVMKTKGIMFRNTSDIQKYNVAIINEEQPALSEIILEKVNFEVASAYVEDYNASAVSTN